MTNRLLIADFKLLLSLIDDLIVQRAIAEMINQAMLPALSSKLYSYKKGVPWWKASTDFAAYVRAHRRSHPDPRKRGISFFVEI